MSNSLPRLLKTSESACRRPWPFLPLVFLAVIWCDPTFSFAQTGGYSVTATLNPFFIHPTTGEDLTAGYPLTNISGLIRGEDGWLYGLSVNDVYSDPEYDIISIFRVNPATGAVRVLYVLEGYNADVEYAFLVCCL